MSENWEELIRENREVFDQMEDVPREAIWQGVIEKMDRPRLHPITRWVAIAASVLLVFGAGMWMQAYFFSTPENLSVSSKEFANAWDAERAEYLQLIEHKKSEIGFTSLEREKFPGVFEEMELLDADFESLLADRELYPNEEALRKILIKYHERQLKILERLEYESRKTEKKGIEYEKKIY